MIFEKIIFLTIFDFEEHYFVLKKPFLRKSPFFTQFDASKPHISKSISPNDFILQLAALQMLLANHRKYGSNLTVTFFQYMEHYFSIKKTFLRKSSPRQKIARRIIESPLKNSSKIAFCDSFALQSPKGQNRPFRGCL